MDMLELTPSAVKNICCVELLSYFRTDAILKTSKLKLTMVHYNIQPLESNLSKRNLILIDQVLPAVEPGSLEKPAIAPYQKR